MWVALGTIRTEQWPPGVLLKSSMIELKPRTTSVNNWSTLVCGIDLEQRVAGQTHASRILTCNIDR